MKCCAYFPGPKQRVLLLLIAVILGLTFVPVIASAQPASGPGSIAVFKYNDLNRNGQYDAGSESGLKGWTFTIGNDSQTTGSDGKATFDGLTAGGEYEVCETPQAGWTNSTPLCQTITAAIGGVTPGPDSVILTTPAGNSYEIDFLGISNGGLTWTYEVTTQEDSQKLSHWVLGLCVPENEVADEPPPSYNDFNTDPTTQVTGAKWESEGGTFSITFDTVYPVGITSVGVKSGSGGGGRDKKAKVATGEIAGPDCNGAPPVEPVHFGNYQLASLGDRVWYDDGDGIQNNGETGVSGVKVTLYTPTNANCTSGDFVADTTTDDDGKYLFESLDAGEYYVEFSNLPIGYTFTTLNQGTDDTSDSDADRTTGRTVCTSLKPGDNDLTWDAGLVVELGISKFQKVKDSGEGWTMDPLFFVEAGDTLSYQIVIDDLVDDYGLGLTVLDTLSDPLSESLDYAGDLHIAKYEQDEWIELDLSSYTDNDFFNGDTNTLSWDIDNIVESLTDAQSLKFWFDVTVNDKFSIDDVIYNQADLNFDNDDPFKSNTVATYAIPEPGTLLLLGIGLFGLFAVGRKRVKT